MSCGRSPRLVSKRGLRKWPWLLFTHRCLPVGHGCAWLGHCSDGSNAFSAGAGLRLSPVSCDKREAAHRNTNTAHHIWPATAVYPQDGGIKTGTSFRAARFLHVGCVLRINRASKSMKALHLAATAVTFAAIFSALMLCGAALTATLHKAIASAPVSTILS